MLVQLEQEARKLRQRVLERRKLMEEVASTKRRLEELKVKLARLHTARRSAQEDHQRLLQRLAMGKSAASVPRPHTAGPSLRSTTDAAKVPALAVSSSHSTASSRRASDAVSNHRPHLSRAGSAATSVSGAPVGVAVFLSK
jgi:hypothetical protein